MHRAKIAGQMTCSSLVVFLLLTELLWALPQSGVPVDQVHTGTSLVALVEVAIRDHAPGGGALYVRGRQTGSLRSGEVIAVEQEQRVPTLLGNQKWVYFSRPANLVPPNGWVLVGNAGSNSGNFGASH